MKDVAKAALNFKYIRYRQSPNYCTRKYKVTIKSALYNDPVKSLHESCIHYIFDHQ